jgi:hypothetical protein
MLNPERRYKLRADISFHSPHWYGDRLAKDWMSCARMGARSTAMVSTYTAMVSVLFHSFFLPWEEGAHEIWGWKDGSHDVGWVIGGLGRIHVLPSPPSMRASPRWWRALIPLSVLSSLSLSFPRTS